MPVATIAVCQSPGTPGRAAVDILGRKAITSQIQASVNQTMVPPSEASRASIEGEAKLTPRDATLDVILDELHSRFKSQLDGYTTQGSNSGSILSVEVAAIVGIAALSLTSRVSAIGSYVLIAATAMIVIALVPTIMVYRGQKLSLGPNLHEVVDAKDQSSADLKEALLAPYLESYDDNVLIINTRHKALSLAFYLILAAFILVAISLVV